MNTVLTFLMVAICVISASFGWFLVLEATKQNMSPLQAIINLNKEIFTNRNLLGYFLSLILTILLIPAYFMCLSIALLFIPTDIFASIIMFIWKLGSKGAK